MVVSTYKINGRIITCSLNREEMATAVSSSSAYIKQMCGIGNNAAWSAALEALDHVRQHPRYKQAVKKAFLAAIEMFRQYENRLVYAEQNRMFHLDDLTPEYRKRYGNVSDREYYDYWASTGATAYARTRRFVTSLWNKYRLSLISHEIGHADIVAWAMAADACLRLAQCIYEQCVEVCIAEYKAPREILHVIFGQLNIKHIADAWDKALNMLAPETEHYELSDLEKRNIQNGLDQLMEEWSGANTLTDSITESTEAFGEIFRTKGEQKKALRMLAEMRG